MVNIFLFIELLKATDPTATVAHLKMLELMNCKFANVVELNKEKIVAQLDCDSYADATKTILEMVPSKALCKPISLQLFARSSRNNARTSWWP